MSPRHFVVFGVLVALGLAGGLMLITREPEIALMHYRDKDFETALAQYQQRLAAGDVSISVVMPLCQLYLQFGKVDAAIALMERFVGENPDNTEARQLLAKYYQYSQRPNDYVATLEKIADSNPSERTLRELSDIYNFRGEFDKQVAVLNRLIEKYSGSVQDFLDLANIQASRGEVAGAAATIEKLEAAHPEAATADIVQFYVSLLLDSKQSEKAVLRTEQWLKKFPDADLAIRFASLMGFKGYAQEALRLARPFEAAVESNPALLAELTQIELLNMQHAHALERLQRLDAAGRLPDSVLEPYLDLLLTGNKVDQAMDVARRTELRILPNWLLSNLAAAAFAANRADFAGYMIQNLKDAFLDDVPVFAARLALALGDAASAGRWIDKAEGRPLSVDEKLALASVYSEAGRRENAIRLLAGIATNSAAPDSAIVDLANLYLDSGAAEAGLPLLETLKRKRPSIDVARSWALLAAKAGPEKQVLDWLSAANERLLRVEFLDNLYYVANDTNKKALAAATADRLYRKRGLDSDKLLLAGGLLDTGQPAQALPHLRALVSKGDPKTEALYGEALRQAAIQGAPVGDELRNFWSRKLAGAGLDRTKQEEAAQALLDLNAYDAVFPALAGLARRQGNSWLFAYVEAAATAGRKMEVVEFLTAELGRNDLQAAERTTRLQLLRQYGSDSDALPYLREFAQIPGGEWVSAYEEALERLGKRADLIAFWKALAIRADVPPVEKRSVAFRCLEAGEKQIAEEIFWALAQNAPPASPDVSQLLFIWGPRPGPAALDWLEARARGATGAERAAWMEHLIDVGAPNRAAAVGPDGDANDVYLRALVASQDARALSSTIKRRLAKVADPDELRRLGRYALEMSLTDLVRAAYTKLLMAAPNDPEALRRAGNLDFVESRFPEAKDRLGRYLARNEGDYESHFYFGEMLQQEGNGAARMHFEKAVALMERADPKTFQMRTIHALTLQRLGKVMESVAEFERLIREQPDNKHLRADYTTVLIQAGKHDDARRLLGVP